MENASTMKIDIHNSKKKYERRLQSLKEDKSINAENKKIVLDFLHGCELGKISAKQCSPARLTKYIYLLTRLNSMFNNKSFRKITEKEIEDYYSAHKDQYGTQKLDEAKPMISQAIFPAKRQAIYQQTVDNLKAQAKIEINEKLVLSVGKKLKK